MSYTRRGALAALMAVVLCGPARPASVEDLIRAYPQFLAMVDGTDLIWRDGTRMRLAAPAPGRSSGDLLDHGSILDQLSAAYPAGAALLPPSDDPGRVRNTEFFDKMYGDCRAGQVAPRLVQVTWLPSVWGRAVSITSVNGVDRALDAVSRELDQLPAPEKSFLYPIGGTYKCRDIAGTHRPSMHSWGAAIDINPAFSDYWRWSRPPAPPYRNRIPPEIVTIFERHGFIWGGRWSHFDTMHFEYRPELLNSDSSH